MRVSKRRNGKGSHASVTLATRSLTGETKARQGSLGLTTHFGRFGDAQGAPKSALDLTSYRTFLRNCTLDVPCSASILEYGGTSLSMSPRLRCSVGHAEVREFLPAMPADRARMIDRAGEGARATPSERVVARPQTEPRAREGDGGDEGEAFASLTQRFRRVYRCTLSSARRRADVAVSRTGSPPRRAEGDRVVRERGGVAHMRTVRGRP